MRFLILILLFDRVRANSYEEDIKIFNSFAKVTGHESLVITSEEYRKYTMKQSTDFFYSMILEKKKLVEDVHVDFYREKPKNNDESRNIECKTSGEFGYLRVKRFVFSKEDRESIVKCIVDMKNELLIDVRGNKGGEFARSNQLASLLLGVEFRDGEILQPVNSYISTIAIPKKFPNAFFYAPKNFSEFRENLINFEVQEIANTTSSSINIKLNKIFFVLFDGDCASACEDFLMSMKNYSKSILVSDSRSYGGKKTVMPFIVKLPFSGVYIKLPIGKITYKNHPSDGTFFIYPDIQINQLKKEYFKFLN